MLKKRCGRCKIEKVITNFYKNKRKKDGYQNYCVSCMKKTNANSFQKNKKKRMSKSLEWQRSEKGGKYRSDYYKHGSKRKREVVKQEVTPEVYQQQHVEHRTQYMATTHDDRSKVNHERYERNKSDILAQQKEYRAKKKVRAESIEVAPTNRVELVEVVPTKKTLHDFCCERDSSKCQIVDGVCTLHKTVNGKRKVDCLVNPEDGQLARGSGSKVVFHCDVCQHDFLSRIGGVTHDRRWCGMCSLKWKHCGDESCIFCHEKSFASYLGMTPNGKRKVECLANAQDAQLSMCSNKKVLFSCDVCKHNFKTDLRAIVCTNRWCNMCSSKWKHCNADACLHCYKRSFMSYSGVTANDKRKVDCLVNPEDAKLPKGSNIKCNFQCDVCNQNFGMAFNRIIDRNSWCPHCKNKTELKVFFFLTKEMNLQVKREYSPPFQWRDYKKRSRFDFLLVGLDIILEIDGPQHTEEVSKAWISTTLFHRQLVDKWKEFLARRHGKRVFRFNQHAIWMDSYDWKREMRTLVNTVKDI